MNCTDKNAPVGEQTLEIPTPAYIDADFCMICKGDSMINARIFDSDVVYIRQQDTVENGEIAAVMVDGIATLGRVWKHPDGLALVPENPKYATRVFYGEELSQVQIIGKAVACTFMLPDCAKEDVE